LRVHAKRRFSFPHSAEHRIYSKCFCNE
jgi:hypothetical protein